jgi:hypothetical protein
MLRENRLISQNFFDRLAEQKDPLGLVGGILAGQMKSGELATPKVPEPAQFAATQPLVQDQPVVAPQTGAAPSPLTPPREAGDLSLPDSIDPATDPRVKLASERQRFVDSTTPQQRASQGIFFNEGAGVYVDRDRNVIDPDTGQPTGQQFIPGQGVTDRPTTGATGGGVATDTGFGEEGLSLQEIIDKRLESRTAAELSAEEALSRGQIMSEDQLRREFETQRQLRESQFAPRFQQLEKNRELAQQSLGFAGAARGSLFGNRQQQFVDDLNQKASEASGTLQAELNAQLRVDEAALRGASDAELAPLREAVNNARAAREETEQTLELAQNEFLASQAEAAGNLQVAQQEAIAKFYEDQGLAYNPVTGETALNPKFEAEVRSKLSTAAKTDAQALEILNALENPEMEVKYFTDNSGFVTATFSDPVTGEVFSTPVGDIGASKAASGAGGAGGTGLGGTPGMDFDLSFAPVYDQITTAQLEGATPFELFELASEIAPKADAATLFAQADRYNNFKIAQDTETQAALDALEVPPETEILPQTRFEQIIGKPGREVEKKEPIDRRGRFTRLLGQ